MGSERPRQVRAGVDADALSTEVPDHVAEELLGIRDTLVNEGKVPVGDELDVCYSRFRQKFGPDALRSLDGEALLTTMHGRGTRDSLVYWLEFKNDEEFPAVFGSISGGSALKFGIYQSTETSYWMTGHPRMQERLSERDAVELVRKQRDQLVAGAEYLASLAASGETPDYEALHSEMERLAPDLANAAWGHKYFALMVPTLLDPYHAIEYQKYHLIRLHKLPSDRRYENARLFAGIANQLAIPMVHLGAALNRRDGEPRTYWRVGTTAGDDGPSEWPRMQQGGYASVGWSLVGDLSGVERTKAGKDHVRSLVEQHHPGRANIVTWGANQLFHFATAVEVGDVVVAMQGATVLGVGEVTGPYYHEQDGAEFPHRRPVRWGSSEEWKLLKPDGLRTTFVKLKHAANLVEVERRRQSPIDSPPVPSPGVAAPVVPRPAPTRLDGILGRIQDALDRKCQVILYGPPGTGKTYWAQQAVRELAARSWFSASYADLSAAQRQVLVDRSAVEQCCFHPAYGYEDFLIGYRPVSTDGNLAFEPRDGIFAALCRRASNTPDKGFYLVVDEINRGDIPRIFGELLTVLEKDKRDSPITLPLTGEALVVPPNVYLVGTMNTADRSVALLDAALRRRFAFVELMPDPSVLGSVNVGGLPLGPWLAELNRRIVRYAGRDARNLQIGHSYLLRGGVPVADVARFVELFRDDVLPLLQEYCYEDFDALEKILGDRIVQRDRQQFNEALFHPSQRHELIGALLASFDTITATSAAADADGAAGEDESDDSDDGDGDADVAADNEP